MIDINIYRPSLNTQNSHTCYPFAEFQDVQPEGCLHIQMRYGSTQFQKNPPSKSKKAVKPHQI